ncbi:MAG: SpoIIE family protein phosphatase [Planctomycetes bacterium]|nr:SpoIIE family protein phosphatase [Planctomycetota bacterium]
MARLRLVRGEHPQETIPLSRDSVVLGRHTSCDVRLAHRQISRHHVRIFTHAGGFLVQDLGSNNGTRLNGRQIDGDEPLTDGDEISLGEFAFVFEAPQPQRKAGGKVLGGLSSDSADARFVEGSDDCWRVSGTFEADAFLGERLSVNAEAKLKAVLAIGRSLGRVLEVDDVLGSMLSELFKLYGQADKGFIVLRDMETGKPTIRASRYRRLGDEEAFPLSRTILDKVLRQGQAIRSDDASQDGRFAGSNSLSTLRIRSTICAPLPDTEGRSLGAIQLVSESLDDVFTDDDLGLLVSVATQAGLALQYSQAHEAMLKQRVVERELDLARQLQQDFLPREAPKLEGYEFAQFYRAAGNVGGDYFDYIPLHGGRLAVTVADVSGKGVPAAMYMAKHHAKARNHLTAGPTLAEAMGALNADIKASTTGFQFITCVIAVIDPAAHLATVVNAGHLPVVRRRASGEVDLVGKASGPPLAIEPDARFEQLELPLEPGDTLLFYTDGVTEAVGPDDDIYGDKRLMAAAAAGAPGVEAVVEGVVADVEKFVAGKPQSDDMCVVGIRRQTGDATTTR